MILAGFADEAGMRAAVARLATEQVGPVQAETFGPAPPEDEAGSPLPAIVLAAGLAGGAAGFGVQAYAAAVSYPMNVGGRPLVAWPSFLPATFESAILAAILAGVLGFLILCRLPTLYDPVDESDVFRRASRDLWFVVVRGEAAAARRVLAECGPLLMDEVAG